MTKKLPPGDPILALDDIEFGTLQDFALAMLERDTPVTEEQMNLLAGLLYWTRTSPDVPGLRDYTGETIHWVSADGTMHWEECLKQEGNLCVTSKGAVDRRGVALHVPGNWCSVNWPPKERRLTGVL